MSRTIFTILTSFYLLLLSTSSYCFSTTLMVEICNNGIDDDGDGLIDCMDDDCFVTNSSSCIPCLGDGLTFADVVIEYSPTCFDELDDNVNTPENALGEPNYMLPTTGQSFGTNFVSLGFGGTVILGFTDNVLVNSGNSDADLWVFEIGPAVEGTSVELRPVDNGTMSILTDAGIVDSDGDGFFEFGDIGGATSSLDLDNLVAGLSFGAIKFDAAKLTDLSPGTPCAGSAGSDIDAVCALSSISVEICNNGIDDDGDGLIDCMDDDCFVFNSPTCIPCLGDGQSFADIVVEYNPTCFDDLFVSVTDPTKALGESDYIAPQPGDQTGQNFVSLGYGGNITLGFTNNVLVNSGSPDEDIWIFEVGTKAEGTSVDLRPLNAATITIITDAGIQDIDGDGFYEFGGIGGATSGLDLDNIVVGLNFGDLQFDAVKLTDLNPDGFCFGTAGSDIEAVCALSNIPAEICDNGIDDDGDGDIDCDDADLANDCCCLDPLTLDLGPDIDLCQGTSSTLDAGAIYNSYLWSTGETTQTITINEESLYAVTVVDECDNLLTDTIVVVIYPNNVTEISEVICSGDSIIIDGITYNATGIYQQTYASAIGCDSTVTIIIETEDFTSTDLDASICQGDQYNLNGEIYTESGSYQQSLANAAGCDSIINLNLTVTDIANTIINEAICQGETVIINDITYDQTGTYEQLLQTEQGCDSIVSIVINILPESLTTETYYLINGQSVTVNGEVYDSEGAFTQNFTNAVGCDSILVISIIESQQLIHYDLNDCLSFIGEESDVYDEFTPTYADDNCIMIVGSIMYRDMPDVNRHSCTPGVDDSRAACVSSVDDCDYPAGNDKSLRIKVKLDTPSNDSLKLTTLSFYEKAPLMFEWIDGASGLNNYPSRYGIRLMVDGIEVFRSTDIETTSDWTLEEYDLQYSDVVISNESSIMIEFIGYCTTGIDSPVNAWDIDEISIYGSCINEAPSDNRIIAGKLKNQLQSDLPVFTINQKSNNTTLQRKSNEDGFYAFNNVALNEQLTITAFNDDNILEGVSTLDLIMIQKHILNIEPFSDINQLVAADINKSGSISALDLVQLQKVILGIDATFPNNHSWVGVNTAQELDFSNCTEIVIDSGSTDSFNNDFYGVKVGDVSNDDYSSISDNQTTNRNIEAVDIILQSNTSKSDNATINVIPLQSLEVSGLQFEIQLNKLTANELTISSDYFEISTANYHLNVDGLLTISIIDLSGIDLLENQVLLTITTDGKQAINNTDLMNNEVYTLQADQALNINWVIQSDQNTDSIFTDETVQVYPNPSNGSYNITFNDIADEAATIRVIDTKGQLVYTSTVNNKVKSNSTQNLMIDNQTEGIYYLQVIQGDNVRTKKIIVLK